MLRHDGFVLVRDTFTFLCFAAQYGIRQTQQGNIYKRVQKDLLRRFEMSDDTPKVYDQINPGVGNPDRLTFILEFCWVPKDLLVKRILNLLCSETGQAWIQKTDSEKNSWTYTTTGSNTMSQAIPQFQLHYPLYALFLQNVGYCFLRFKSRSPDFAVNATWTQTLYSQLERSFVNHLTYMGGIAFAHLEDDIAIQVTDIGRHLFYGEPIEGYEFEPSFIVQPNHEVLASSYLAPEIRWKLNHIARTPSSRSDVHL